MAIAPRASCSISRARASLRRHPRGSPEGDTEPMELIDYLFSTPILAAAACTWGIGGGAEAAVDYPGIDWVEAQ